MTTKTYNKLMFHFSFFLRFLTNEMLGDLLCSPKINSQHDQNLHNHTTKAYTNGE
jgi:hypothetical protein